MKVPAAIRLLQNGSEATDFNLSRLPVRCNRSLRSRSIVKCAIQ